MKKKKVKEILHKQMEVLVENSQNAEPDEISRMSNEIRKIAQTLELLNLLAFCAAAVLYLIVSSFVLCIYFRRCKIR